MQATVHLVPGPGTVTRVGTGVVLTPVADRSPMQPRDHETLEGLTGLEGSRFTSALLELYTEGDRAGAVAPGEQGWAVLVPGGMRIVTRYADRTSDHDGPQHSVKHHPLEIAIIPGGTEPPTATADLPVLGDQPGEACGIVVVISPTRPPEDLAGTRVQGRGCGCGVLVPPTSLSCWACTEPIEEDAPAVEAVRPTLGTLRADDGTAHPLTSGYVIGRDPHAADEIGAHCRPLALVDHRMVLSRVHAVVSLEGWEVHLTDRSINGTWVRPADGWQWERLPQAAPMRLLPGSDVRMGHRILRFQPPRREVP
ncbi:MAG: FHA domain-containing protein [Euzebya sp.]